MQLQNTKQMNLIKIFYTQKDEEKKGNEEATHEVPNQFVKEPCGRKTKFIEDNNKKYLNAAD